MKKLIIPAIAVAFSVVSCSKKEEVASPKVANDTVVKQGVEQSVVTNETPVVAPELIGTYEGTLPCASCPGIKTKLVLSNDGSFVLDEEYLEEKDGKHSSKGSYEVEASKEYITIKEENTSEPRFFKIVDGKLYHITKIGDAHHEKNELIKK